LIDLYRVGVHIGMTTNSTQVLAAMLRQLTGVQTSQKAINQNFKMMATLAAGAMAAIGGVTALKGLWSIVEASRKLNDELTKTKSLGGEFAASIAAGRATSLAVSQQVKGGFAFSDTERARRELATQVPGQEAAAKLLPHVLEMAIVTSQVTGEKPETMIQNIAKSLDIRGKIFSERADGTKFIDPDKFLPELAAMSAAMRMTGGMVKSTDLLAFMKQAALPVKTMSAQAIYADMVEAITASSAHRVGTSTTSLFSQFIGGTMPLRVAEEMQEFGLLKEGEFKTARGGRVIMAQSATDRFSEAMRDPLAYIAGPLNDMLTARGMNDEQKLLQIFRLFGRQTVQRLAGEAITSGPQYERARSIFSNIMPIQQAMEMLNRENLNYNIASFTSAWQSFIEALGDAGVPTAISILQSMTGALHELTRLIEAHPNVAAGILGVAGGFAAMAAIGGAITVLTMGLHGLAVPLSALAGITGLTALGTGLGLVATGLASLIAPVSAILGLLKIGSDAETPENRAKIDQYKRSLLPRPQGLPNDGYDAMGRPIAPAAPPPAPTGPSGMLGRISYGGGDTPRIAGDVYLDGQKVGQWMAKWMAGQTSRPAAGPSAVDTRMTFVPPGGAFA
jgi:hypothetical protein